MLFVDLGMKHRDMNNGKADSQARMRREPAIFWSFVFSVHLGLSRNGTGGEWCRSWCWCLFLGCWDVELVKKQRKPWLTHLWCLLAHWQMGIQPKHGSCDPPKLLSTKNVGYKPSTQWWYDYMEPPYFGVFVVLEAENIQQSKLASGHPYFQEVNHRLSCGTSCSQIWSDKTIPGSTFP